MRKSELRQIIREEIARTTQLNEGVLNPNDALKRYKKGGGVMLTVKHETLGGVTITNMGLFKDFKIYTDIHAVLSPHQVKGHFKPTDVVAIAYDKHNNSLVFNVSTPRKRAFGGLYFNDTDFYN
jgi:hypothetical protein